MNVSDFQQCYRKFLLFHMEVVKIKDCIVHDKLSKNQIDLLLSVIGLVFTRLSMIKDELDERKCDLNEKKNEQTLF